MSVLNFFKINTNDDMTGWERKILQGLNIQADNIIEHRLDYYGENQQESPNCWLCCSCKPPDFPTEDKIENYQELKREL